MGLTTSHNAYQGSYSGFGAWRRRIAELGGYPIVQVPSYWSESQTMDGTDIDYMAYKPENFAGKWDKDELPEDPLLFLIIHSDCAGMILPTHCKKLADRLDGILKDMDPEEICPAHYHTLHSVTAQFIEGLRLAHKERRRLRF